MGNRGGGGGKELMPALFGCASTACSSTLDNAQHNTPSAEANKTELSKGPSSPKAKATALTLTRGSLNPTAICGKNFLLISGTSPSISAM